jgi:hypothetical protein
LFVSSAVLPQAIAAAAKAVLFFRGTRVQDIISAQKFSRKMTEGKGVVLSILGNKIGEEEGC